MFSSSNVYIVVFGVLISLSFIIGALYFVNKLFANDTQEILVRFILLIFTALVALFIVDKVVAFKIKLLTDENNNQLFDLIKTLVLMIFSYYFGTKKINKDDNK
jgi:hypothetical protein